MQAKPVSAGREARLMVIRGRVQGVNFRRFAAGHAKRMSLTGYARNLPDGGTVEVFAEGYAANLDELETLLKQGPIGARVDSMESSSQAYAGDYKEFRVL